MKEKILEQLKKSKEYVSGQELCRIFGVSRTAVWKCINRLQEEGYEIEAVRNKGYRLISSPDVLTEREIAPLLPEHMALRVFSEVDSTNEEAKRLAVKENCHGTLVIAEKQTGGKGRRGRSWESPAGSGIWMTLVVQDDILPERASMLTLAAAMAVREGIERATGLFCEIKWPNDIVSEGKKVCGILTEMSAEEGYVHYIVIGIGINCNTEEFPKEIASTASSIKLLTGKPVHRADVVGCVMQAFFRYYDRFMVTQDMSLLKEEYDFYLTNRGREVLVLDAAGKYKAKGIGLADDGALVIETEEGRKSIYSGEVSVRGIYGYSD